MPVGDLCREHGISSASYYKWRSKYGSMDASLMARMQEFDDESEPLKAPLVRAQWRTRLKEMYAEKSMQNNLLNGEGERQWFERT